MRKERYYDLEMEVIHFDTEDVITTSNNQYENAGEVTDDDEETDP